MLCYSYDKVVGIPACRGVCATCQSPLGPQCVKCGVTNSQHSAANTEGSDMNSEDSADSFPHSVTTSDPESEEKECEVFTYAVLGFPFLRSFPLVLSEEKKKTKSVLANVS